MPAISEEELNIRVADLLDKSFGLNCRPERRAAGQRPDIRCYYAGLRVVIEASYSASDAERDAAARLGQGLADIAVALHYRQRYPDVAQEELHQLMRTSKFDAKVLVPVGLGGLLTYIYDRTGAAASRGGWFEDIGLELLGEIIRQSAAYLVTEAEFKQEVENVKRVIDDFVSAAEQVDRAQGGSLSSGLADVLYRLYGFSVAQARDADIIFGQAALALLLSAVFYEEARKTHGLRPVRDYVGSLGTIAGLRAALEDLVRIDREPALELAIDVLGRLPRQLSRVTGSLIDEAERVAGNPGLLARDFAGRVYHEITGDIAIRKGFATYYTEVPAAYLLTDLALRELLGIKGGDDMSPEEALRVVDRALQLKVADFACGSGTLLTASLYNISRLVKSLCFSHSLPNDLCPRDVERRLVKDGIYGLEPLRYAAQITAINLALMAGGAVSRENVRHVPLGYRTGVGAWLGSLEMLQGASVVEGLPRSYDLIVMNPPFSRATGRSTSQFGSRERGLFGFIADPGARESVRSRYDELVKLVRGDLVRVASELIGSSPELASRLGQLLKAGPRSGLAQYLSVKQAGEGLPFLYLAYRYVRPGGVIAFVLPRNALSGVSWFLARALLVSKFHLRYVIVSADGEGGYGFSEGSGISEALIVARRADSHSDDEETTFVVLLRKPDTALEALALSEAIAGPERAEGRQHGVDELRMPGGRLPYTYRTVKRGELLKHVDNLGRFVALPEGELVSLGLAIMDEGDLRVPGVRVPVTPLNNIISSIGVDRHGFADLFRPVDFQTPYPIVYGGEEGVRTTIKVSHNAYAEPRGPRGPEAFSRFAGRLLLPDRVRFNTAHAVALYSDRPVLSNIFYAVRLNINDERRREMAEKALALWLNTTWGVLTVLLSREETEGAFAEVKMGQWRLMSVLDVTRLDDDTLERLAKAFDEVSGLELGRLPEQYSEDISRADPARLEVDVRFLEAVGARGDSEDVRGRLADLYSRMALAFRRWLA